MDATQIETVTAQPLTPPGEAPVLVLRNQATRRRNLAGIVAGIAALAVGLTALGVLVRKGQPLWDADEGGAGPVERLVMPTESADLSIILDTDVMPLAEDEARVLNEQRPLDVAGVTPADPFRVPLSTSADNQIAVALKCLAQAIYYEAASESEAGQRAVAQVVLNRVKHPAFPNTICGVVYQGSQRVTGCQFTFTCDGSLARLPLPALYSRAERYAREAISGRVAPEVGNSTNYHADYVVPYWASSLDKLTQIGRHIFYGLRGAVGNRSAFRMRYDASLEADPTATPLAVPTQEAATMPNPLVTLPGALVLTPESQIAEDKRSGALIPEVAPSAAEAIVPSPLRADQERGQLVVPGSQLDGVRDAKPVAAEPR